MHLDYLERDGVGRDGSPGHLYSADENFRPEDFRRPLEGEQRQFRFIVSPEDGDALDLTAFTRRFMAQVEKDLGRDLIWTAVNHHNTDNAHIHIVVRGVDKDGRDLRIDRRYISQEMRWRAREIATRELGPRPTLEFSNRPVRGIEDERLTEIDRMLGRQLDSSGTVSLQTLLSAPRGEGRLCLARLQTLAQFGLAQEQPPGIWKLAQGWQESLAQLGEHRDLMERLYPLVGAKAAEYSRLDAAHSVSSVEGVIRGLGLDDELTGRMFLAIETQDGQGVYVPLAPDVAATVRTGEAIRVESQIESWVKASDRIIARFAQQNDGFYDPPRHQKALEDLPHASRDPREATPTARIVANTRRLERLAAYHLVARMPDGRWRIPPDLIAKLESRERTHPRSRLHIIPLRAPEHDRPAEPVLRAGDERLTLGHATADKLGLAFVSEPVSFRGRLIPSPPGPSGSEYVRVVDDGRRQFTLVPKPKDAERLRGKVVTVSRNPAGQLFIRTSPEISR